MTVKPNFVIVLLDDATDFQMRRYLPQVRRKLLDAGLRIVDFKNAFDTTPLCCPSRTSLLTGRYAHTTGIKFNEEPEGGAVTFTEEGLDADTIATRLGAQGYATALVGKYLNGYDKIPGPHVPPGWDFWRAIYTPGTGGYRNYALATEAKNLIAYGAADADYSTDVFRQWAVRFLRKTGGRPFLLYLAPSAPHEPAIHASRHAGVHPEVTAAPRPPSYATFLDRAGKPEWVQNADWTAAEMAEDDALYASQVKTLAAVEEMVGGVIDQLAEQSLLADTVFVILSDNGYSHGEHFSKGKGDEYDPSVRTALAIASKSFVPQNQERFEIAANIDVAPTLAELAGLPPDPTVEGVSLAPLLSPGGALARTDLLLERWSKNPSGDGTPANPVPTWDAVVAWRGGRLWKYVELAAGANDRELYDLKGDPYELANLVSGPEHAALVAELSARLAALKGGA